MAVYLFLTIDIDINIIIDSCIFNENTFFLGYR